MSRHSRMELLGFSQTIERVVIETLLQLVRSKDEPSLLCFTIRTWREVISRPAFRPHQLSLRKNRPKPNCTSDGCRSEARRGRWLIATTGRSWTAPQECDRSW